MPDVSDKILQLDRDQEEHAIKARAGRLGLPYLNIRNMPLDADVLKIIPLQQVEAAQVIAIQHHGTEVMIGVVEPESTSTKTAMSELAQMTGLKFTPVMISPSGFAYGHQTYSMLVKENEGERPVVISEKEHAALAELMQELKSGAELPNASVTDVLSAILATATARGASDVHFEPAASGLVIRFRIDGVLHLEMKRSAKEYHGLANRIKYLAKLPLVATLSPQGGRFTITVSNETLDLRVASLPTVYGDMITIRILRQDQIRRKIVDLGLRQDLVNVITKQIAKPHGMILVTGPTGSGKTTTLYALLEELNTTERKIITIEDPVEYKLEGLEQSQVDPEHNYSFVEALRGALRQDPDVIMIGEIRDAETAETGVRAALTGHIVLATLHTNDAPSTYSRLLEMGVEPFLFSGSLNVIMAQRLVRLLCPNCKAHRAPNETEAKMLAHELGRTVDEIFDAGSCDKCDHLGFKGRVGIFEAVVPSHAMEQLALLHSSVSTFHEQAIKDGMVTLMQDGLLKVEQGITSIAEVMRVANEEGS